MVSCGKRLLRRSCPKKVILGSAFVQDFPAIVLESPVLAFVHPVFEIAARVFLSESDNS
jgi:hypothetical protein